MKKKRRYRVIGGFTAYKGEGKIWTWDILNRTYRWCPLGNVEELLPDGSIVRVAFYRTLDGAVAYTVGFNAGQRTMIVPRDIPRPGRN